jgi:conjugal transfer pilin signal peptidase TrbI
MLPTEAPTQLAAERVAKRGAKAADRRGTDARRWLVIGGLAAALAASSSLASWRDEHAILINTTQSLPNWAFWIDKHRVPQRGDFVVFKAPQTPLITAHFGKVSPPFAKRVYGMPGDVVSREGNVVRINGTEVARLKPASSRGEPLAPGPVGRIPERCYYLGTAHKDGLDSRYADIGFVCANRIIGTGDSVL